MMSDNSAIDSKAFISQVLSDAHHLLAQFLSDSYQIDQIGPAINEMSSTLQQGGTLFSCGNGGSFCDAMHFAEELSGRFVKDRKALRAIALSDGAHITCVANDYGYDHIFSRGVEAYGRSGDLLLAISTSGNSPNIINAVKSAKLLKMKVVGLLGKGGGQLKDMVDIALIVPSHTTERIQEIHIKLIHLFIEGIERNLFPNLYLGPLP